MKLLEGIRVLDISTVIAAPFAAGLMADFGAEVIKDATERSVSQTGTIS